MHQNLGDLMVIWRNVWRAIVDGPEQMHVEVVVTVADRSQTGEMPVCAPFTAVRSAG
ncbi:MAG: hypothetical protein JO232_11895 [Verrucomicrobia bacterium]|nr:hypothetical protein [Verrucomicrobiota bacterium]